MRIVVVSLVGLLPIGVGCSGDDDEPGRIDRIEGPAQVDDDVTPEQSPAD